MIASPIRTNILFAFLNVGANGQFNDATKSGIVLTQILGNQAAGRWAKALLVGPENKDVKAGQYIFIKPLMWTTGFTFDGVKIWKTEACHVLATSDEMPEFQVS